MSMTVGGTYRDRTNYGVLQQCADMKASACTMMWNLQGAYMIPDTGKHLLYRDAVQVTVTRIKTARLIETPVPGV
ncbi:hypothetical protein D3C80_2087490 [compost metagenome]